MSRIARVVIPGLPHHITQRGNRREEVFTDDADRHAYLNGVRHAFRAYSVKVWAYCLMTNHVHSVAVPEQRDSLALAFRDRARGLRNKLQSEESHLRTPVAGAVFLDATG